ncbi:hypothetical protein Tco_0276619 [Tanacetum coccineum]
MSNGETPFSLAYGIEAVIPAEIGIPIRKTIQRSDEENEEALRMNLNLLEEWREIATIKEARRKQQVEKYYNQRVHYKQFKNNFRIHENTNASDGSLPPDEIISNNMGERKKHISSPVEGRKHKVSPLP